MKVYRKKNILVAAGFVGANLLVNLFYGQIGQQADGLQKTKPEISHPHTYASRVAGHITGRQL
jgi:hypothetical protein